MSAKLMMTRTATILRRVSSGEKDRYNNEVTETVEEEVRCGLQPRTRSEHEDRDEIADSTWRLYLPWGTDLDSGDAVEVDGERYELVGDPWRAEEGSRSLWHIEASVRRTTGTGVVGS